MNPTSSPHRPPATSNGGSRSAPRSRPAATRPRLPGTTPRTWTSCSPNSMRRSTGPGCAATWPPTGASGGTGRPGGGKMPRRCRAARLTRGRSARPTPRRTARRSARRCSSPSPARPTAASPATAHPSTRTATTTPRPRGTRCTSPRCSTGSSRTCAATAATTCSTSPPSNRSAASPRTFTWRIRGTVSRRELREVIAATYHQVWWPSTAAVRFDGDQLPVWDEANATYLDPDTGEVLPTWDQALDAISDQRRAAARRAVRRPGSTPRACSPDRGTRTGASAT